MAAKTKSNELTLTRVYDAPVAAVWDAWTDPEQVAQWWGPRGFTITTHSKDLRPGGHWSYTMHGPDGTDYENTTKYFEVDEHKRLVYDHGGGDDRPPLFRVTVSFSEFDGKTKMDMTMSLASPEAAEAISQFIKKARGHSTWDRLAEYLEKEATGKETFVINRTFDAPLEVMFEMWTNPDHLTKWLPPAGFGMKFLRADIKPGGSTLFSMSNSDFTLHARAEYQAIDKPSANQPGRPASSRIVYTQQFCDEQEHLSRHPMAPLLPATLLTTVTLTAEGPDQTRVTVTMEPHGPTTAEELKAFIDARAGMTQGWTSSFDKLEGLVAGVPG
jgi:uncharacterized protein YndB with AHSA1/START domain